MRSATQRYATRRDTLIFVVCVALSVLIRFSPENVTDSLASGVRSTLLAPLLFVQENAELQKNSRLRYTEVVTERDSLAVAVTRLGSMGAENRRLRDLLGLSGQIPVRHVPAEVLHETAPTQGLTAILSVGRSDGVSVLSPVISSGGLVGVVQSVDEHRSMLVMWPHPEFRVSVMTDDAALVGNARAASPTGPSVQLMEITGVSYVDRVQPGTVLYTSGLGGVWPRGIAVGTVLAETSDPGGWERTYLVQPFVHPAAVSHVIVLLEPAGDLRSLFQQGERAIDEE